MLLKQTSLSPLSGNLALSSFGELLILFSTKLNPLKLLSSTAGWCCLLHLIKQNCLLKSFLRTLTLMTQASLSILTNLDISKVPGLNCILVVFLKICEPELSYILAELFNVSEEILFSRLLEDLIGGSCIGDCLERSTTKGLLSVVSKVFEKLVNNRIVNHLDRCRLFSDFQSGFMSSRSTVTGLLTGLQLLEL